MAASSSLPSSFFCGTGNVGLGLALALQARGWPVAGAWNRRPERAAAAERHLGMPVQRGAAPAVPPCDIVWVTVSDDAIAPVAQALAAAGLPPGCVLAHTSGCLTAEHLGPGPHGAPSAAAQLATKPRETRSSHEAQSLHEAQSSREPLATPRAGPARGSMHPLLACPTPERTRDSLGRGAFFALEGDPAAVQMLRRVTKALGGTHAVLQAAAKPRYHAAAVLASNLMVALLDLAGSEAQAAGLADAAPHLARFALGAVENAAALGTVGGLTGPALRGDVRTLQAHMQALSSESLPIYRTLSAHAVSMARARGLSPEAADASQRVLRTP